MRIENAMIYQEDGNFALGNIYTKGNMIVSEKDNCDYDIFNASGLYAIPGLTDIHFHGCMGYDLCDGNHEALEAMAIYEAANGITTICPASMTYDEKRLKEIFEACSTYPNRNGAILCGINMEGPFISHEKKGSQNAEYIQNPDIGMFTRLQESADGLIKLVSISPEIEGAAQFIETFKDRVILSIAHTVADYNQSIEAMMSGAKHVTHLFNAMPAFQHRDPGVIGAAYDMKDCTVEIISDGIHIHPSVIRAAFSMFTDKRIVLVSDSMEATGMPDGYYNLGGQRVEVSGKTAKLADGTLAGSASNLMDCLRFCVKEANISLESAIRCAAVNPAKLIGIYDKYGSITPNKIANIVLLDKNLDIVAVILKGKRLDK